MTTSTTKAGEGLGERLDWLRRIAHGTEAPEDMKRWADLHEATKYALLWAAIRELDGERHALARREEQLEAIVEDERERLDECARRGLGVCRDLDEAAAARDRAQEAAARLEQLVAQRDAQVARYEQDLLEASHRIHDLELRLKAAATAPALLVMSIGVDRIARERIRQVAEEGWSAGHDAHHSSGQLVDAAACYLDRDLDPEFLPLRWPWAGKWWKPKDRLRNLERAGALIAAEIDRLVPGDAPVAEAAL